MTSACRPPAEAGECICDRHTRQTTSQPRAGEHRCTGAWCQHPAPERCLRPDVDEVAQRNGCGQRSGESAWLFVISAVIERDEEERREKRNREPIQNGVVRDCKQEAGGGEQPPGARGAARTW